MPTARSAHLIGGRSVVVALGIVSMLLLLARSLAAQQAGDVAIIQPEFGVFHDRAPRREGENRWGWSAGVRFGVPIAHRVHALGTLSFLRVDSFERFIVDGGGFVYAAEDVLATVGVGFDVIARPTARVTISAECGPVWTRKVGTDLFGSPRPELALGEAFGLGGVGITNLDIRRALTPGTAIDLFLRGYVGEGGMLPALGLGLAVQLP
jgi:hypothetical protein